MKRDITSVGWVGGEFFLGLLGWRVVVALLVAGVCGVALRSERGGVARGGAAASQRAAGARIAWKGCGKRLQCARVRVPLDWSRPRGPQISLAVIRYRASGPGRRIGSLFVNPGGPGGSVEQVKHDGAKLDAAGQGRFDIVGWDVRGAGESTRVRCFRSQRSWRRFLAGWALPIPGTTEASLRFLRKAAALTRRCGEVSGSLLAHISTADTVRDLDYLRRLVGDQRLTYYGISGGTFIGETYANMFPAPGARDRTRRHRRPGRLHEGQRGRVREHAGGRGSGVQELPLAVPARGAGALRARRAWLGRDPRRRPDGAAETPADPRAVRIPQGPADLRGRSPRRFSSA